MTIISKRFQITYHAEGTHEELPADQMGGCNHTAQKILIEDGLEYDTEKEVVLHEVLHAIDHEMATNLTEEQVDSMGRGILATLMANPSFAKYLVAKAK
jgi:hypothetical protein